MLSVYFIIGLIIVILAAMFMGSLFPYGEQWQIITGIIIFFILTIPILFWLGM